MLKVIADAELEGNNSDDPSILFSASAIAAAKYLGMADIVFIHYVVQDNIPHVTISVPAELEDIDMLADKLLNAALIQYEWKLQCESYLMATLH